MVEANIPRNRQRQGIRRNRQRQDKILLELDKERRFEVDFLSKKHLNVFAQHTIVLRFCFKCVY